MICDEGFAHLLVPKFGECHAPTLRRTRPSNFAIKNLAADGCLHLSVRLLRAVLPLGRINC